MSTYSDADISVRVVWAGEDLILFALLDWHNLRISPLGQISASLDTRAA